jgi:dihydroxyacetone kinase-like protein
MKRLMNAVDAMLDESLDGFAAAHADVVELGADRKFVRRRVLSPGKVALISGGGDVRANSWAVPGCVSLDA